MIRRRPSNVRNIRGHTAAAVPEFVLVMVLVLIPVFFGVLEVGRLVLVKQLVSNSAREGARLAAQGRTINQIGAPTIIVTSIDPAANPLDQPNVKAAVVQSLRGAGLTGLAWDDVTVSFAYLSSPAGSVSGATEPYQGVKDQRFAVTVTVPFDKVRWTTIGLLNPASVTYTAEWRIMVDDPFSVNTTVPSF